MASGKPTPAPLLKKLVLAGLIASIVLLYVINGGENYVSIDFYQDLFVRSPFITITVFFLVFLVGISCSLPVAGVLSVCSGIVFGSVIGFLVASAATTLGGTVALYTTRYLLHDLIKRRFPVQIEIVNKGIKNEGVFYLFSIRLITIIPFGVLNLLLGLTSVRAPVFMLTTLFGMAPVLLVLTYAGSQLGDIESTSIAAVFTPGLILSLSILAIFPLLVRAIVSFARRFLIKEVN